MLKITKTVIFYQQIHSDLERFRKNPGIKPILRLNHSKFQIPTMWKLSGSVKSIRRFKNLILYPHSLLRFDLLYEARLSNHEIYFLLLNHFWIFKSWQNTFHLIIEVIDFACVSPDILPRGKRPYNASYR